MVVYWGIHPPVRRPIRWGLYLRPYDQWSLSVGRQFAHIFSRALRQCDPDGAVAVWRLGEAMKLLLGLTLGAAFGAVIQLSGASSHTKITNAL